VCLAGAPAWVTGIGETLEPLPDFPRLPAVLVNPGRPLSTAAVFAARHGPFADPTPPPRFTGGAALVDWLACSGNDLEAPARELEPEIGRVLEALSACSGCRLARMSGSGATCFGLFDKPAAARAAARRLATAEDGWWVRATALGHPGDARA
jgi:4-diphosphocytidyl-2-C-methyl-D-erythritol kinase